MCSNEKAPTKSEHYIPELLLKYFCDENNHIEMFNVEDESIKSLFIDNVFQANDLFEVSLRGVGADKKCYILQNELENAFRKRESLYTPLVESIIRRVSCPSNANALILTKLERDLLDELTANLLLRSMFFLNDDQIKEIFELSAQEVSHREIEKYFHENHLGDPKAIYDSLGLRGMLNPYEPNGLHVQTQKALSKLNCSFFYSFKEELIAGNNLVHYDSNGYSEDGPDLRQVFFTLCPHIAVVYQSEKLSRMIRNQIVPLSPEKAMEYNMEYMQNIPKKRGYLFARDHETIEKALSMWKKRC